MDIYVLDRQFQKVELVEGFVSFIWTERWDSYGDFELKVPYGHVQALRLRLQNYLYIEESRTLMRIERYEKNTLSDDGDLVTVSGRSIVSLLTGRIHPGYTVTTPPFRVALNLVKHVCVTGDRAINERDVIDNLRVGALNAFGDDINYETGGVEIYDAVRKLATEYDFGFSMDFDFPTGEFVFRVSEGRDLRDKIKFCPRIGNLSDVGFLKSLEDWKNVAYVYHRDLGTYTASNRPGHGGNRNFRRSAMLVDGSHVEDPTYEKLWAVGQEALSEHDPINLVDGEFVSEDFRYRRDFLLGDRVQVSDEIGNQNDARIVEHIWSYDNEGFKSYPTFKSQEVDD